MVKKFLLGTTIIALTVLVVLPFFTSAASENSAKALAPGQLKKTLDNVVNDINKGFALSEAGMGVNGESVAINNNGDFRITGVVVNSVSGNVLNVSFMGFSRSVDVTGAKISGQGGQIQMSNINAGDKLVGKGHFDKLTHAISVAEIHDLSVVSAANASSTSELQGRINSLMDLVRQLQQQLQGLVH